MGSLRFVETCVCIALGAPLLLVSSVQQPNVKPAARAEEVESLNLAITFPESFGIKRASNERGFQLVGAWSGNCGNSQLQLRLLAFPLDEYHFEEPLEVADYVLDERRHEQPNFVFDEHRPIAGPFGIVQHAICARTKIQDPGTTNTNGVEFFLCGMTDKMGYVADLTLQPMPDTASLDTARVFLATGFAWKGKPLDPKWSKEEAEARWERDVPDAKKNKLDKVLRTDHYVVLTNSSGGKSFAEKMEECYARIKATFPFEELPGERLMPVFLFRNPDEYFGFFVQQFHTTVEQARRSKGVAYRDFYATWYEAPNDPVHIHEGTHQIFASRLRLPGGGSWFQEGVAEYMCTSANDRNTAARLVKKGRQMPLAEFVQIESLLFSSKAESKTGEDDAASQYELAAFLIEFARESRFSRDHFLEWFHAIGQTPRNNVPAIEAATRRTLGVGLAGFEAEWVEYAKKR